MINTKIKSIVKKINLKLIDRILWIIQIIHKKIKIKVLIVKKIRKYNMIIFFELIKICFIVFYMHLHFFIL